MPVVLLLHGLSMNGRMMMTGFGVRQKADQAGFILVCPDGANYANLIPFWNSGGLQIDEKNKPDDVAFTSQLLDKLEKELNIDTQRVYVIGLSNGAMMAHRLAIELPERIAAISTICGTLSESCTPTCPMPVLHFHGTEDHLVPIAGSAKDPSDLAPFRSLDDTIAAWVKADGCPQTPTVEALPDKAMDGMRITKKTYGPGRNNSEVILYVIEGGGHTWPGVPPPVSFIGRSTSNISATDLIWDFFEKHPKK
jgi:polyhydroxybutyrate depolymerase